MFQMRRFLQNSGRWPMERDAKRVLLPVSLTRMRETTFPEGAAVEILAFAPG
jgi:hypothetical protein